MAKRRVIWSIGAFTAGGHIDMELGKKIERDERVLRSMNASWEDAFK